MPAYARYGLDEFLSRDLEEVVGALQIAYAQEAYATQYTDATDAWVSQIEYLRRVSQALTSHSSETREWSLLLEYPISRRAKRIDAIILAADLIFVLEFKSGRRPVDAADRAQVEDYALDLRDFHVASRNRTIVPVLIAPESSSQTNIPDADDTDRVQRVATLTGKANALHLQDLFARYHNTTESSINPEQWDAGEYRPVPTILEAARFLYATHSVREINHSAAGAENLTQTSEEAIRVICWAKETRSKAICFITGVPGAGKTLAGLNIVHGSGLQHEKQALAVFLSGNGPLVHVLTEALAQDHARRERQSVKTARRHVSAFVHNVHRFLKAHEKTSDSPENVVVFDEAQRAWDRKQSALKFKRDKSEPELMLEIMNRLEWAVVVALVGTGQEINSGEAGLPEWGRTLRERFPTWTVHVSELQTNAEQRTSLNTLFPNGRGDVSVVTSPHLHLSIPQRSFRAQALASWVEDVLGGRVDDARRCSEELRDYPIRLTRDLEKARSWLRDSTRGCRRAGLIASSGARRLRPFGLDVTAKIDARDWFLNSPRDVRSSNFLEIVATEFAVQGLELNWAGVCWDADLRRKGDHWVYKRFAGTEWTDKKSPTNRQFALNKYRVLLTRAREGMVIWVPNGTPSDRTRLPEFYDETAEYLRACGVECIDR